MEDASEAVHHQEGSADDIEFAAGLFAEFESIPDSDEGFTTEEWAKSINVGVARARKIIGQAIKAGKMAAGKRVDNNHWSGRACHFKVYRVLK